MELELKLKLKHQQGVDGSASPITHMNLGPGTVYEYVYEFSEGLVPVTAQDKRQDRIDAEGTKHWEDRLAWEALQC